MTILVTGSAGFIGFHVSKALLDRGDVVIGIDNFNSYYDPKLKEDRNAILEKYDNYKLYRVDITNQNALDGVFDKEKIDVICHLAAQAGVSYSLEHPEEYAKINYEGTMNIFEAARIRHIMKIVFASSSSVYGNNPVPWEENKDVDRPINPYAASKRGAELLAYTYVYLYGPHITILRFFTVYGPWGRPDMAYFTFTDSIAKGNEIKVRTFPKTSVKRDFTFIDDIVGGVLAALDKPVPSKYDEPEVYNLGNSKPENLDTLIALIENNLGKKANKKLVPLKSGEFIENFADIEKAKRDLGFEPKTRLEEGIKKFVAWYREYYKIG